MSDSNDATWSVKEVFTDLKRDLIKASDDQRKEAAERFDKQDVALIAIDRRLDSTATKEDLRREVSQVHSRIDGIERDHGHRISVIEKQQVVDEAATTALTAAKKGRWSTRERVLTLVGVLLTAAFTVVLSLHA